MRIRAATAGDAEPIAAIVIAGDESFEAFAPAGWRHPSYEAEVEYARDAIGSAGRWVAVAEAGAEIVGYVAFVAAALTRSPVADPGLAHLGRLFVRPDHWGAGVATALHDEAVGEATDRGFTTMRLFTPTAHARARRFYEREGWRKAAELPVNDFGMPLTEYRRALAPHRR